MRSDGDANKELVYDAMSRMLNNDVIGTVSPKQIYTYLQKDMHYRTIHRHLHSLVNDQRIYHVGRGEYITDESMKIRRTRESAYKNVLKLDSNIQAIGKTTIFGKTLVNTINNPFDFDPLIDTLRQRISGARLKIHGKKSIAETESGIWMNAFWKNLLVEVGSTGSRFRLKSGQMFTSFRQELPITFFGWLFGKVLINKTNEGVDVKIVRDAVDMMQLLVLDLVDWTSYDFDMNGEIVIKIRFNPQQFLNMLNHLAYLHRTYTKENVFQDLSVAN